MNANQIKEELRLIAQEMTQNAKNEQSKKAAAAFNQILNSTSTTLEELEQNWSTFQTLNNQYATLESKQPFEFLQRHYADYLDKAA